VRAVEHQARPTLGYAQVLAGAALFGLAAIVSKMALTAGIAPARLSALRCTGAALGLLLFLGVTQPSRLRVSRRDLPLLVAVAMTGAALIQWLYFTAIDRLPVGIALLLEFTGPLMIAVYARVVQRQAVSRRMWLALALALLGLAMVAQVVGGGSGLDPIGVAAGLAAAVCLAAFYLLSKRALERHHPLTLTFWMFALAALFWAVVQPWWTFDASILTDQASMLGGLADLTVPVWVPVLWLVVLGTLTPYALEIASLRHLTPTSTGIVGMSEPVIAAVIAWIWLGESLDAVQVVGALLVLVGVALVQTISQPGDQASAPLVSPSFEPV
jgi:drug/metabolite transporter (DMT)-like permease